MKIFNFIILSFAILAACSEAPPPTGKSRNKQEAPADAGFGNDLISDPCVSQADVMGQAGMPGDPMNTGLPDLPTEGGAVTVDGFQLNNGNQFPTDQNNGQEQGIPGVVNENPEPIPGGNVGGIPFPQPGCGGELPTGIGAGAEEEDPYVYEPGIETDLKNCTDSGKLFNVRSGKCTSQSLASWQCNADAIMDPSFKKVPQKFKDILQQDLNGQFSGFRLYACVEKSDGDIELHFFKRKNDRTLAWDFWKLDY